ncbi:outer membrane protein [Bradyrhizobium sp.]|uniref:outer membrane protein n=1 Tax=Bradyrhizobium sp. TaxID=376 RepID=UPI0023A0E665|nr:outer membrane protein [Bradyrhizobium sp.]MDE2380425.1 porin family protein [Bradyrhizobium sp.]
MRGQFLTSVAVVALFAGSPALAGSAPPVYNWSGFYVGANVGGVWAENKSQEVGSLTWFDSPPAPEYGASATGLIGGVHAGYNWQFQQFVFGIEGDISAASADANTSRLASFNLTMVQTSSLTGLATLRGRAGFAVDRALLYLTAGVATGNVHDRVDDPNNAVLWDNSGWRTGWTAGGGFEYAVARNWTVKAEALYVDFGNSDAVLNNTNTAYRFRFKDTATVARAGFNFKF